MPLQLLPFVFPTARPPQEVRRFLRAARGRISRFQHRHFLPAFVACDFPLAYAALLALEVSGRLPGSRFCEWGSGMGVVTCLAGLLGFDAWGIESEGNLVEEARELACEFDMPAEFARGSFILPADAALLDEQRFAWLDTEARCGHAALGLAPDEFDLVFAYPWPDEQDLVYTLFDRHAHPGAFLLTAHCCGLIELREKV